MSSEIGTVYANALFSLAKEQGDAVLQQTRADLRQCAVLFSLNPDLTRLLSLPTISVEERIAVAQKIFGGDEGLACRLLYLLIDRSRVPFLGDIADAFDALMMDYQDMVQVQVTTAVALQPEQEERLIRTLQEKLRKTVRISKHVDRSIIGGMIVQYGDTRLDNSLRSRLDALKTSLSLN